jgi:transcriptional regulator with XRE-family HTH domain
MSVMLPRGRLRDTREYLGLSAAHVAQVAGIEPAQLAALEAGQEEPNELLLHRLARAFGCTPALLSEDQPGPEEIPAAIARMTSGLSDHDRAEALTFAWYLRHAVEG